MADFKPIDYDTAAARNAGLSDTAIADFLVTQVDYDLEGARKAGLSDTAIVDFLAPERAAIPAPKPERSTWGSDIKTGFISTSQAMAGQVAIRAAQEIESLKGQIETFRKGDPELPDQLRHLAPRRESQIPRLEKQLADAEKRFAGALAETGQDAETLKKLPVNEPMRRFVEGDVGEILKNPGAVIRGLIGQSLPAMAPVVAGTALGGIPGGAIAGGAVGAATGGGNQALRVLQEAGVDLTDRDAVLKALDNAYIREKVDEALGVGQAIEGTVGAATGALGGVTVPGRTATAAVAKNVGLQAAGQSALSAGGEATQQAVLEDEMNVGKIAAAGIGEAVFAPADAAAGAFHARGSQPVQQRPRTAEPYVAPEPDPEVVAMRVMRAGTVDEAIAEARTVLDQTVADDTLAQARAGGSDAEVAQAEIGAFASRLKEGEVSTDEGGNLYFTNYENEATTPLRQWDGVERPDTIPKALADAQRQAYEQLGVKVIHIDDVGRNLPMDGAFDPSQPDTIFLSTNPQRSAAMVGGHELTHLLGNINLPDNLRLLDLIEQNITAEGLRKAYEVHGQTAPERASFPEGEKGDALHVAAVMNHLFGELGADIGGEAPKFQGFIERVAGQVEARYGATTAKQVLQQLLDGLRQAMTRLREFFVQGDQGAEYGVPTTVSQNWITNIEAAHDIIAGMYAKRYGEQAGLVDTPPAAAATEPQRMLPAPALVTPPPPPAVTPENVFQPQTYGLPAGTEPARAAAPPSLAGMAETGKQPGAVVSASEERAAEIGQQVDEARQETNTEPTDGQKEAGNYLKGRVSFHGLPFVMENPKGSTRSGVDGDGKRWEATLPADYGYLSRTEGADGDQVDAYIGPRADSQRVWVVDQIDPKTGKWDEHKVMLGMRSVTEARAIYQRAFSDGSGPRRIGAITEMSLDRFKDWLKEGDTTSPVGEIKVPSVEPMAETRPVAAESEVKTPAPSLERPVAPEQQVSEYDRAVREERERLWAEEMPGRKRGLPHNERVVTDSARETVMRRETAADLDWYLENGLQQDQVYEVARLYRRKDGQTPREALDQAVDRFTIKAEATALRYFGDEDLARYDSLKMLGEPDPVMKEVFDRLEEFYSGRPKELPGDEDIPIGQEPTRAPETARGEVASATAERPEGGEAGARPRDGGETPAAPDELGPAPSIADRARDWLSKALGRGQRVEVPDWMERSFEVNADLRRPENRDLPQAQRWALEDALLQKHGIDRADYARYLERIGRLSQDESADLLMAMEQRNRETTFTPPQAPRRGPVTDVEDISFSPRERPDELVRPSERAQTQPLVETPEATPERRQRQREEIELLMRGRKTASRPQQTAEDTPLFGGERQKALFSPRIVGRNPTREYTPEQIEAFERVGRVVKTRTWKEIAADFKKDLGTRIVREMFDPYVGLKNRDPEGYLAVRTANSNLGAVEMFNNWGTLKFGRNGYLTGDQTGGVVDIIRKLGPEAHDFISWVAGNRAAKLKAEDRENLFSDADIATYKGLNKGTLEFDYELGNGETTRSREAAYLDALKQYEVMRKNLLELAVEGGLLKRGVAESLWEDPFYVPFYRVPETDGSRSFVGPSTVSGFVKQAAFKKLKGGTEKLASDLWGNFFGNAAHMIDASIRNKAANRVLDKAVADGVATEVSLKEYTYEMSKAEQAETVWTMRDGEKTYYRIDDPFLLKAISALDYVQSNTPLMNIGRGAKKVLQVGVAASPNFQIRNLMRDTVQALAVSPISRNVFKNLAEGTRQQDVGNRLKNVARAAAGADLQQGRIDRETADAIAGGATMRYASGVDQSFTKADTYLDSETKIGKFLQYFSRLGQSATETMAFTENVSRLALYKQLREKGEAADLAAFEARDLADFTMVGASPIIRTLVELVPYMNAWMQGLYKVGRAAADADKSVVLAVGGKVARQATTKLAVATVALTAIDLALNAIYEDDEDFKAREEYDRNANFWFKAGGLEWRIPRPFEVGALSKMASIWTETLYNTDMTAGRAWKNTRDIFLTQMAFNPIPQAVKPLVDLYGNETRTGRPIEGKAMERLRPEYRSNAGTTMVAEGISDVTNRAARGLFGDKARSFSPVQLDYLVQAYTGWLGTSALQIADTVVRAVAGPDIERPDRDTLGRLTAGMVSGDRTSERGNTFYTNLLYEQGEAIQQAYNTYRDLVKRGRTEEAAEYLEDNRDQIVKNRIYQRVIRTESQLNEQIRAVTNSPTLSGEQKRVRIQALQAQKNRVAKALFSSEAVQ
jgi:hypothetical protein